MRTIITQLPDGEAVIALKAGIKSPDDANTALYSAVRKIEGNRVFITGPGSIPSALWTARAGAAVTIWTDNANYAACLKETFKTSNLAEPRIHLQADFESIDINAFDSVLLHLPRGKTMQMELLQLSAAILKEGGKVYFVGAKKEGVKSALKFAKETFHYAGIITQKGGYHVGLAQKPPGHFDLPQLEYSQNIVPLAGNSLIMFSCPGVFAAGRMDEGAKALIDCMDFQDSVNVLDMGCGTGLVGAAAVRKGASVTLTDVSARAVESTRRMLEANGLSAAVYHMSGAERCEPSIFDIVYSNPPFHKGRNVDYETTRYLLNESARALRSGGILYLVANIFLKYGPWMQQCFGNAKVFYETRSFRVWKAIKH